MASIRVSASALCLFAACFASAGHAQDTHLNVRGKDFVNKGLVAVGRLPAALRDKFGETFGSGSGMTIDPSSWHVDGGQYTGTLYLLPDRGYNVEGTTDYRARLNNLKIVIKPVAPGESPAADAKQTGVKAELVDTMLLQEAGGQALTGLDPVAVRAKKNAFPELPQAKTGAISLDPEAIVRMPDGTFFISDEYGPAIYRFSADGKLLSAISPPPAFNPIRHGETNFSSNNPGPDASRPNPLNPEHGRQNNQGFEGMAPTPDGRFLVVVLQSATRQDGGDAPATRRNTRALVYDIADVTQPKLVREHVVPLPVFQDATGKTLVAAQSELLALGDDQFLLLSRDSNNGQGMPGSTSLYRSIDVLDLNGATNIAGTAFDGDAAVAPKGVIDPSVTPAKLTPFLSLNDNAQLNRFGLHNGAPNDSN
ncbi:MAG: hypothetical protein JWL62_2845, partial [Hyphomicrobiales bacterium]|nr:hypothetical protein [Hyphomicrobiales bacterium]